MAGTILTWQYTNGHETKLANRIITCSSLKARPYELTAKWTVEGWMVCRSG